MLTKSFLTKLISGILSALLVTVGSSGVANLASNDVSSQQIESIVADVIENDPEVNAAVSSLTTDDVSGVVNAEPIEESKTTVNEAPKTETAEAPAKEATAQAATTQSNAQSDTTKEVTTAKETASTNTSQSTSSTKSVAKSNTGSSVDTSALAREAFNLINDYRASKGLNRLEWSASDAATATARAREIVTDFSHHSASGLTFEGENIAITHGGTASEVFNEWKNSPGHNANMLEKRYVSAGLAVYVENGTYYWVNDFTFTDVPLMPGDEGTTTSIAKDGSIITVDNNNPGVLSVGCDVVTDDEGWATGHIELMSREADYIGAKKYAQYRVRFVTDTGIWGSEFLVAYIINDNGDINYEKDNTFNGINISWRDIQNNRKVLINMETDEIKWK